MRLVQTSPAHRRSLALLLASTAVLAGCGGGAAGPLSTLPTTDAPATTTATSATSAVASGEPVTVPAPAPVAGPVQFDVVVGRDAAADRIETVAVGSDVTINVTNPDAADEFHLHGIDLERAVDAGVMATFNFTADTVGTFELESHVAETVLIVIEVVAA